MAYRPSRSCLVRLLESSAPGTRVECARSCRLFLVCECGIDQESRSWCIVMLFWRFLCAKVVVAVHKFSSYLCPRLSVRGSEWGARHKSFFYRSNMINTRSGNLWICLVFPLESACPVFMAVLRKKDESFDPEGLSLKCANWTQQFPATWDLWVIIPDLWSARLIRTYLLKVCILEFLPDSLPAHLHFWMRSPCHCLSWLLNHLTYISPHSCPLGTLYRSSSLSSFHSQTSGIVAEK